MWLLCISIGNLSWSSPHITINFVLSVLTNIPCVSQYSHYIVFEGHRSNFKVTRDKKLPILTWIERFRTVTPVWIHPWLWNDAQSLPNDASGRWIWCPVTLMSVMSATKGAARDCNWHLDGPDRPAVTASSQRLAGQARRGVKFTAAEPSSGQTLWPAFDGDLLNCHNDVVKLTISVSDNVFETL